MIKRAALFLLSCILLLSPADAWLRRSGTTGPSATVMLAPGYTDYYGNLIGNISEQRFLISHRIAVGNPVRTDHGIVTCSLANDPDGWDGVGCEIVLAGSGSWYETACPSPNHGPQILILASSREKFSEDFHFPTPNCSTTTSVFSVVNQLKEMTLGGQLVVVAASVDGKVYARDDTDGSWNQTSIGSGQIRGMGEITDPTNSIHYFVAGSDGGMVNGTFSPFPTGIVAGNSEPFVNPAGGNCTSLLINSCTNWNTDWPPGTPNQGYVLDATSGSGTSPTMTLNFARMQSGGSGTFHITGLTSSGSTGNVNGTVFTCGSGGVICNRDYITIPTVGVTGTPNYAAANINFDSCGWVVSCAEFYGNYSLRVSSMTTCPDSGGNDHLVAAIGFQIYDRVNNGASSTFKRLGYDATLRPYAGEIPADHLAGNSQTGLRGIYCKLNGDGSHSLLVATEGTENHVWRVNVDTGEFTLDVTDSLSAIAAATLGSSRLNNVYRIDCYANMIKINNSIICGEGDMFITGTTPPSGYHLGYTGVGAKMIAEIGYWQRTEGPPVAWTIHMIPLIYTSTIGCSVGQTTPCGEGGMVSMRSTVQSPFQSDIMNGGALIAGCLDANETRSHNTGCIVRIPEVGPYAIP